MRFIVELNGNGIPTTDLGYHLIEAVRYQNWYFGDKQPEHVVVGVCVNSLDVVNIIGNDDMIKLEEPAIPVGSIEFVESYMTRHTTKQRIYPINIPRELNMKGLLQRDIWYGGKDVVYKIVAEQGKAFIKSCTKCKGLTDIVDLRSVDRIPQDDYLISEFIDIEAEWRIFVNRKQILDVKQYAGEWGARLNANYVLDLVRQYKNCPPAYCIDVALLNTGKMALIEAHNFISCGLYGFEDYAHLPQMVASAYNYEITK